MKIILVTPCLTDIVEDLREQVKLLKDSQQYPVLHSSTPLRPSSATSTSSRPSSGASTPSRPSSVASTPDVESEMASFFILHDCILNCNTCLKIVKVGKNRI